MTEFLAEYGIFLAKTLTLAIAFLATVAGIVIIATRGKDSTDDKLEITPLNDKFERIAEQVHAKILDKDALKKHHKAAKKTKKDTEKSAKERKRIYVLDFDGDIKASAVTALREEITAILMVARKEDEVFMRLQSGGGLVHAYGLASSQLQRLREHDIPLTISVDKIAASGGYMMSCVANKIIAAPFAIIGSIGVIAQIPNFHKLLKKHDIDYEQLTAGEFKRTMTVFGENTDKARDKFKEELEDMHLLFKEFISEHRPQVDIKQISTGEHWPAKRALDLKLVDELKTSDDYLLELSKCTDIYELHFQQKMSITAKLGWFIEHSYLRILGKLSNNSL